MPASVRDRCLDAGDQLLPPRFALRAAPHGY
jgi:hypothetical protein